MEFILRTTILTTILASPHGKMIDSLEFLEGAPAAWAQAVEIRKTLSCTEDGEWIKYPGQKPPKAWRTLVRRRGDDVLVEVLNGNSRTIYSNSSRYSFIISQIPNVDSFALKTVDSPWGVQNKNTAQQHIADALKAKLKQELPEQSISHVFRKAALFLFEAELGVAAINRIVPFDSVPWDNPDIVTIRDVSEEQIVGRRVVTVKATIAITADLLPSLSGYIVVNPPHESIDAEFTFDATKWWLPITGKIEYESGAVEQWNATYDLTHEDLPLLTSLERTGEPSTGEGYHFVKRFSYPKDKPDPEEFTLSFYGLPEPPEFRSRLVPIWAIALLGIALVLLAYLIHQKRTDHA